MRLNPEIGKLVVDVYAVVVTTALSEEATALFGSHKSGNQIVAIHNSMSFQWLSHTLLTQLYAVGTHSTSFRKGSPLAQCCPTSKTGSYYT